MSTPKPHVDLPSRLLALLVFLTGVGMLIFVFTIALHLFQSPVPGLNLPVTAGATPPPAANIGTALIVFVRELLLLGVMTLAGSLLAGKGAHLYFGTVYSPTEAPAHVPAVKNGQGKAAPVVEPSAPAKSE